MSASCPTCGARPERRRGEALLTYAQAAADCQKRSHFDRYVLEHETLRNGRRYRGRRRFLLASAVEAHLKNDLSRVRLAPIGLDGVNARRGVAHREAS